MNGGLKQSIKGVYVVDLKLSSKLNRILYLKRLGFNIPRFIKGISCKKDLYEFFKENTGLRFSIRTQSLFKEFLLPHYPNVELTEELFDKLCKDVENNIELLFFESIDPNETTIRGNLHVNKKMEIIEAEFMKGPGTVRDIEEGCIKTIEFIKTSPRIFHRSSLGEIFKFHNITLIYYSVPIEEYVLEFSKLKNPRGVLKSHEIFWEIRRF